jgi:hypothetical protein
LDDHLPPESVITFDRNTQLYRRAEIFARDGSESAGSTPHAEENADQYLKDGQLYFDSIMFTPEGMAHLIAETGVGQVMIGTDYPFPWNKVPVDHIMSIPGLSDDDRIAILGGTAAKLLRLDA